MGLFGNFKPKASAQVPIKFSIMNTLDSEKDVMAEVGAELEKVAEDNDIPINYKCKKGECGTCLVNMDNKWVKACQTQIPSASGDGVLRIQVKPQIIKAEEQAVFFSPKDMAKGFFNNAAGVVGLAQGFVDTKVDNEYEERIAREAKIAEIAAAKKAAQK